MTGAFLLYLAIGKLLIWIFQKLGRDNEIKIKFISKLLSCSLCAGFWVYSFTSWITKSYAFQDWIMYIPVFSEIVTGVFSSYIVYVFENGWKSLYEVLVIK